MNLACQKWSYYKRSGIWVDPPPCFFSKFPHFPVFLEDVPNATNRWVESDIGYGTRQTLSAILPSVYKLLKRIYSFPLCRRTCLHSGPGGSSADLLPRWAYRWESTGGWSRSSLITLHFIIILFSRKLGLATTMGCLPPSKRMKSCLRVKIINRCGWMIYSGD